MCNPLAIVGAVLGGANFLANKKAADSARKDQKKEAARLKRVAADERSEADQEARSERRDNFNQRRRSRTGTTPVTNNGGNGLFAPRSFFQV